MSDDSAFPQSEAPEGILAGHSGDWLTHQLRRERLLSVDVDRAVRLLKRSLARFEEENLELAQAEINRMLTGPVPVKHQIRAHENPEAQKLLRRAFSLYRERQLQAMLAREDVDWQSPIGRGQRVGIGSDERSVELPLVLSALRLDEPGTALDAGASLNIPALDSFFDASPARVTHVTQSGAKERHRFNDDRISYVFCDLRDLPFRSGWFDRVACVSTLEHIGMDNTRYGGAEEHEPESYHRALDELMRVLRPGGTLFLTFPVGVARSLGWFQIFDPAMVSAMIDRLEPAHVSLRYFTYDGCWVETDRDRVEQADDVSNEIVKSIAVIAAEKLSG